MWIYQLFHVLLFLFAKMKHVLNMFSVIGGSLFLGPQFIYANPYKIHSDDIGRDMNCSSYSY